MHLRRATLAIATLTFVAPAGADEGPETIVVTAGRREGSLTDAPLSLVALSGDALDASGIDSTLELPLRVPGMVVTTNTVLAQPYLRGVGSDLISVGAEASVATFVDGVYRARPVAALQDFYDIARVEVAKGPQGTLFGRNATGGMVHVVTADPAPGLAVGGDLGYGSFDDLRMRAFANVPVVDDLVLARISGIWHQRDGYLHNDFLGRGVDDEGFGAVRSKLLARPSDSLEVLVSGDYSRERSSRNLAPKLVDPLTGSPAFGAGGTVPVGPRDVFYDLDPDADVEDWGASLRADLDLGAVALRSLTAYRETKLSQALDLDATDLDFVSNFPREDSRTISQEMQLASVGSDRVDWLAGLFYLHEDASASLDVRIPPAALRDQPSARVDVHAVGIFGQIDWRVSPFWKLGAGLRYSYEHKRQSFTEVVNGLVVADFERDEGWDAVTPRVVLEYTPRPDLLLYASAARGFKSGGFNTTVAQPDPFDPESLWALELGSRFSSPARARLHVALFYYDYDDIQLQVISNALIPFPRVENAGAATIWGAEAELVAEPVDGPRIELASAYLDARFDELVTFDPNDPAADPDQSGNRMPRAPEFSTTLAVETPLALSRFGTVTPRIEYRYQSSIFFDAFEDPETRQRGFGLWSLALRYDAPGARFSAAFYARNLTDELYRASNIRADGQVGNLAFWGAPRSFGIQVGWRL